MSIKKIIIDLNSPKATSEKDKDNFIYADELDKVVKLIHERIIDITNIENSFDKSNIKESFEELRMHDTILIDGKRGSGKTTFLLNLKAELERKNKNDNDKRVKILDSIDPNQLDEKSNILLILLAHVYTELVTYIQKNLDRSHNKKDEYKKLTTMLHNLTSAISATQERNYEDDYHKLYNLHQSLIIDETLHNFFSQVCDFFKVQALILPIDDIDMDFIHGYKVVDSIRKYLSTPKIIPIISIDTTQIYALIKTEHYQHFGYSKHGSKNDIKKEHELGFLKALPEEYLQKIMMPTRKIVLYDMYELYKLHIKKIKNIFLEFDSDKSNEKSLKFNVKMDVLLKSYLSIVFGNDGRYIEDVDNFNILNYLKDKSFRSFYEDMIAFMNGVSQKDKVYVYDTNNIKTRLIPLYISHFDTKYDATIWFWDKYMSLLKNKMNKYSEAHSKIGDKYINSFYVDISKYILYIDSFDDDNIPRHEQIYVRLYMQDFFIKNINIIDPIIDTKHQDITDLNIIQKEIDVSGIIELSTRTMLPMHIFEVLINEQIVDIFKYNLSDLKLFGRDNNNTLRDTMFNLSTSILKYYDAETFKEKAEKQKNIGTLNNKYFKYKSNIIDTTNDKNSYESNKKIIGIFLEKKYKDFFGNYSVFIEKYTDFRRDEEIYFLSPLKYYSILPLYFKAILEDKPEKIQFLIEDLTKEYTPDISIIYGIAFPLLTKEDILFTVDNSNLGVISINTFSKKLVQNILRISIQHYADKFIKTLSNSSEAQYRRFLDKNINAYKTIYFNHLILFLVKKIDNDIFKNLDLDLREITQGTREEDFYKDKIKESFFADNIRKILIKIEQDKKIREKYKVIEPFIYKLYLTLLKNKTYQNSFYIKKDKDFDIKEYIIKYYKEIKNSNDITLKKRLVQREGQFKELRDLYKNLDKLYVEAD